MIALLDRLLRAEGWDTIEALALALQLTRTQVAGQLQQLRQRGCQFDQHPQHGVRLRASGLETWGDYIERQRPRRVAVYRTTISTQDIARSWVGGGGADLHGAVVVADVQTGGRGRLGRTWHARPGEALLFSYVHASASGNHDQLTASSAVAVAEALEACGAAAVRIKWPNDLLIDGRKVAGLLVERSGPAAVLGVGVNVTAAPPGVVDATCLREAGVTRDRLAVLDAAVAALDRVLADATAHEQSWRRRCLAFTGPVRLQSDGRVVEGEVMDADPARGLIVRTRDGQIVHLPAATTGRV